MSPENKSFFEKLFNEMKLNVLNEMKLLESAIKSETTEIDNDSWDSIVRLETKLIARQSFLLKKIEHAQFKLKNNTYGLCEECDHEIEFSRIKARPIATQCIECKEAEEKNEDNILYQKKSHTHGREFGTKATSSYVSLDVYKQNRAQDAKILSIH